jgi:hypothetical protein
MKLKPNIKIQTRPSFLPEIRIEYAPRALLPHSRIELKWARRTDSQFTSVGVRGV